MSMMQPGGDPRIRGAQGREGSAGLPTPPHCTAHHSSAAEQEEREQRDEERARCCSAGTKRERRSLCNFITLIKSSPLPYVTALQQSSALHGFLKKIIYCYCYCCHAGMLLAGSRRESQHDRISFWHSPSLSPLLFTPLLCARPCPWSEQRVRLWKMTLCVPHFRDSLTAG